MVFQNGFEDKVLGFFSFLFLFGLKYYNLSFVFLF